MVRAQSKNMSDTTTTPFDRSYEFPPFFGINHIYSIDDKKKRNNNDLASFFLLMARQPTTFCFSTCALLFSLCFVMGWHSPSFLGTCGKSCV